MIRVAMALAALLYVACSTGEAEVSVPTAIPDSKVPFGAVALAPGIAYPDRQRTPGDVFADIGLGDICKVGYTKTVRDVSAATKDRVYAAYGIDRKAQAPNSYELDHLIPLALGGSNADANLWPQPIQAKPGAYEKDRLETVLYQMACAGSISLEMAQRALADDWYAAYRRHVLKEP